MIRAAATALALFWGATLQAQCAPDRVDIRTDEGVASFRVELADSPAERSRGLMFRTDLPAETGMLFLYDRPQALSFWMRNTPLPLDMIFVRPDGVVAKVHANAVPFDETPIHGGRGLVAVLEINGGLAERQGIEAGSTMRHPFFGPDAAWPC